MPRVYKWQRVKALFLDAGNSTLHVVDKHLLHEDSRFWNKDKYKYIGLSCVNVHGRIEINYHTTDKRTP